MKKVKIINGTYGHKPEGAKFITPVKAGEVVDVSDEEAARLASLSVAVCIGDSARESTDTPVATPEGDADGGGAGENPPDDGNGAEGQENGGSATPPDGESDTLDIVGGHFTAESLETMTKAELSALAKDLGADVSKCKNKAEMVAALASVEVAPGDEEAPPAPGAEDPVK